MKRAAVVIFFALIMCVSAGAQSVPTGDAAKSAQDFVRFGQQDQAHGLSTSAYYYFGEALKLQPDLAAAWAGEARALDELHRYDEARKASDRAMQLKPDDAAVWAVQGRILYHTKHYEDALAALDKSLALSSSDTSVYRWKGETLDSLGRHREA
jgi:tetratricopeptide (TPR) repeat protein